MRPASYPPGQPAPLTNGTHVQRNKSLRQSPAGFSPSEPLKPGHELPHAKKTGICYNVQAEVNPSEGGWRRVSLAIPGPLGSLLGAKRPPPQERLWKKRQNAKRDLDS
ncbi:hypothetical protein PGT21_030945 [Puccinia graminis f. sp. tritici]|uniref:Uncharacterized protein n=1 Tax=Puccinia graminis f. sp. tritici TaxID=56615 RepID=A0A5B0QBS8_PUCGR|nr:hypothetical protein PGT21_030945 [Puccinia graminis f. sp. tritici]